MQTIPDLVKNIKAGSSRHINEKHFTPFHFEWQAGYGCFSYSQSQIEVVTKYILNQSIHHKGISLEDEIKKILTNFNIEYDDRYILKCPK